MLFCTAFCEIRVCLLYDIVYPLFISDSISLRKSLRGFMTKSMVSLVTVERLPCTFA